MFFLHLRSFARICGLKLLINQIAGMARSCKKLRTFVLYAHNSIFFSFPCNRHEWWKYWKRRTIPWMESVESRQERRPSGSQ
jgi:hypothetical protein